MTSLRVRTGVFLFLVALLAPGPLTALAADDDLSGCAALEALGLALPGFCNGNGNGAGNNGKGDGSNGNNGTTTTTTAATPTTTTTAPPGTTTTTEPPEAGTTTTTTRPSPATTRPPLTTTTTEPPASTTTTVAATSGSGGGGSTPPPATTTTTAPIGLGAVDMTGMEPALAGAVKMVHGPEQDTPAPGPGAATMATRVERLLGPVAPPALVDAVASPLVIFEALIDALTSSGQALIVPGIAFLVGLGLPGTRRRTLLGAVLDPDLALTGDRVRTGIA